MSASFWDERYGAPGRVWGSQPNEFLVKEVAGLKPGRALDLATGEGRNAVWLAEQGWQVTGSDFSPVGLDKAAAAADAAGVSGKWILADLTAKETWGPLRSDGPYDLVAVLYLHLPVFARRAALAFAATLLAPGGTMLVVGHDLRNLNEGYGGPQDAAILLSPDVVATEICPPLELERAETLTRFTTTSDGSPVAALDTLVRARNLRAQ